jgi:DNA primase
VTLKLYLNAATERWTCFRCSAKGVGLKRLDIESGVPIYDREAIRTMASTMHAEEALVSDYVAAPDSFANEFTLSREGMRAGRYLLNRGVTLEQAEGWGLGYCTEGKLKDFIILPVWHVSGDYMVYWVARSMKGKSYINAQVPSNDILWNWTGQEHIILVEGIFDGIAAGRNAVAMLGKLLKKGQLAKLVMCPPKSVCVMVDRDARADAISIASRLQPFVEHITIATPPEGKDPGDMLPTEILRCVATAKTLERVTREVS